MTPDESHALLAEIMACRFCTIGERGPLLCQRHAERYPRVIHPKGVGDAE